MSEAYEEAPGLQSSTLEDEISEDEDISLHRTIEDEMAELTNMLSEPMVFVGSNSDVDEGVMMDPAVEEDDGIILIGQEKWMFEHERRMLQQEKRMLAHRKQILAQERRMFDQEGRMLQQERWIVDQRKRLFEGEQDVLDMEERIVQEEKKMEERQTGMEEKIGRLDNRMEELDRQMSTLKADKVQARGKNPLTILNLPVEIQIEILSHLPWQYQMYCLQVFPSWKEFMVLSDTRPKRYIVSDKNYCPRMHKIGASVGWRFVVQDGKVESVTYDLDLLKVLEGGYDEDKDEEIVLDLLQSAVLEDPLFLNEPVKPDNDIIEVDKVAFQIVPCQKGYETLFSNDENTEADATKEEPKVDSAEEDCEVPLKLPTFTFTFEEHPQLKGMQIIEFLDWVAKWVSGLEVLKSYKRIHMELLHYNWTEMAFFVLFHDLS